jgi:hypothetical protein
MGLAFWPVVFLMMMRVVVKVLRLRCIDKLEGALGW